MTSPGGPSVGLALIVKDGADDLPNLLKSVEGAFDQVVLLDTGSTDQTKSVFRKWAKQEKEHHPDFHWLVDDYKWIDDFADARNTADGLLNTDWLVWADADDEILGAGNLRALAANAPDDLAAYVCGYDYARDAHDNCACYLRRERLVRRGKGMWTSRVHESQLVAGRQQDVGPDTVLWRHLKQDVGDSSERNRRILERWVEDEPENPRVLSYLGTEHLVVGDHEKAMPFFERYLDLRTGWDEERAQVHRKLSQCLNVLGDHEKAVDVALMAVDLMPEWPDSYLSLAEAYHQTGKYEKAVFWCDRLLEAGKPDTLLIINPLDYTLQPLLIKSSALGGLARWDEAIEVAEKALAMNPDQPDVRNTVAAWQASSMREATAKTWCAATVQLIGTDEQWKALRLIEDTVPGFATDHPEIVQLRSQVRERVRPLIDPNLYREHYEIGGSKPEDFIADDVVDEVAGRLPRAAFLLEGVKEQMAA